MKHNRTKLEIVEGATWDGITKHSEGRVIIEPHWVQQSTPYAPTPYLNGVLKCNLSDFEAAKKVFETIEEYKKLKLPFRWKVVSSSLPLNLRELLTNCGMALKQKLIGFICNPREIAIDANREIVIEELTLRNLEDWLVVQGTAWNTPKQGIEYIRRSQLQILNGSKPGPQHFIGYWNSKPVATAAVNYFQDYAFLLGAAVNPECRGHGIYKTMLGHRLQIIAKRGLPAVVHCLEDTSAPICRKLGFEEICEIESYELE